MNEQKYRIWSFEHNAWWKAKSWGYTNDIQQAGIYTKAVAKDICNDANITGEINEEMRLVEDEEKAPQLIRAESPQSGTSQLNSGLTNEN